MTINKTTIHRSMIEPPYKPPFTSSLVGIAVHYMHMQILQRYTDDITEQRWPEQ